MRANNDPSNPLMEERLKHTLGLVIDFVKFAEAKNAALLAANSVLIVGILQACSARPHLATWLCYYVSYLLFFLSLSVLVALISFMPLTMFPLLRLSGVPSPDDNLVFFGDIAKYDVPLYLASLNEDPASPTEPTSRFHVDLAGQIIINARIALRKYRCFSWALWLSLYGLATPLVGLCVWLALCQSKKRRPNG